MTKFGKFDKATLNALRNELQEVMDKYASKTNLNVSVGKMRFSDNEVDISVNVKIAGAKTLTDILLDHEAASLGITKFENSRGDKLIKFNPRSYKFPFVYSRADGKMYKCDGAQAKCLFAA